MLLPKAYPARRSIRLPDYDYSQPGAYFVTIVTQFRIPLFGHIIDEEMVLNEAGKIVSQVWTAIPEHFPNVEIGEFIIMPNHIHGIVVISDESTPLMARYAVPTQGSEIEKFGKPVPASLPTIMRSFKSATTKRFHETMNDSKHLWQRNYYEHVIRNERDYQAISDYIIANPMNWEKDEENVCR